MVEWVKLAPLPTGLIREVRRTDGSLERNVNVPGSESYHRWDLGGTQTPLAKPTCTLSSISQSFDHQKYICWTAPTVIKKNIWVK
ncbi:hypothetical protein HanIR_Chr15g0735871 [Helianthus annuus]|nr:hypothetical protein HanIR_Chr15g0735871 [Helianthus annuus]